MKSTKFFLILLFFVTHSLSANEFVKSGEFQTLKTNIQQQEYDKAWQLAQLQADEYLGDPDFDFLYGVAGLENYQFELAVFAFERVVVNRPNWLAAQYYLAKSYLTMKNYQAAIDVADNLLGQPELSSKLQASVIRLKDTAYTRMLKRSFYYQQQISASLGYDSNLNAGVDEDNIFLPFLGASVALDEASKESGDTYLTLFYLLNGSKALSQKSKVLFFTQINMHQFMTETEYNRVSLAASVDYLHQFDFLEASIGVNLKPLWFSGDFYRTQANINTGVKKRISEQWAILGNVSLGQTNNAINDYLDTDDLSLSLTGQYFIGNWRHSATYIHLNQESRLSESTQNSSKSDAFSVDSLWVLNPQWLLSTSLSWQHQVYDGEHPFYLSQRIDDFVMFSSMMQFKPTKAWSYQFTARVQDKDSNLPLFSYQRFDLGLTANLTF